MDVGIVSFSGKLVSISYTFECQEKNDFDSNNVAKLKFLNYL